MKRKLFLGTIAFVTAALIGAAIVGVPELIARQASEMARSCLGLTETDERCRFERGPLRMEGEPVFIDGFNHAFLPTKNGIDFIDADGTIWTAPPRTLTDGATIPRVFSPLVGDRQSREYLVAAALHDAYCGVGNDALKTWRTRPWEDVHRMFYEALLVNGTPPQKAKIMFAAVYLGGPRWDDPDRDLSSISKEMLLQEMQWCIEWIRLKNPPIEKILSWMEKREGVMKSGNHTIPPVLVLLEGEEG